MLLHALLEKEYPLHTIRQYIFCNVVLRKQILYIFLSNPATEVPPLLSVYYFFKCTRATQTILYIEILTISITPKSNCRRKLNVANAGCMLMYVDLEGDPRNFYYSHSISRLLWNNILRVLKSATREAVVVVNFL